MAVTMRHFVRNILDMKRLPTIEYPEERRNYSGRFRGKHILKTREDGTLKCVAWDTLSMQLPLLENGTVQGLIGQKYFGWGYDGIGIMYDHVVHGIELPSFIDSGFDLLTTPEPAAEFAKKWETQNFVPEGGSKFGLGDASAYTSGSASPAA